MKGAPAPPLLLWQCVATRADGGGGGEGGPT